MLDHGCVIVPSVISIISLTARQDKTPVCPSHLPFVFPVCITIILSHFQSDIRWTPRPRCNRHYSTLSLYPCSPIPASAVHNGKARSSPLHSFEYGQYSGCDQIRVTQSHLPHQINYNQESCQIRPSQQTGTLFWQIRTRAVSRSDSQHPGSPRRQTVDRGRCTSSLSLLIHSVENSVAKLVGLCYF